MVGGKSTQLLIEATDWNGEKTHHLAPSLNDAVLGVHEILAAAFLHEIQVEKKGNGADLVTLRMFAVNTEETEGGFSVEQESKIKLFEAKLDFWPRRLKLVPLEREVEEKVVEETPNLVELT